MHPKEYLATKMKAEYDLNKVLYNYPHKRFMDAISAGKEHEIYEERISMLADRYAQGTIEWLINEGIYKEGA